MSDHHNKNRPTILYIEANEYNHRLVSKLLEPEGFVVEHAFDGLQGIKQAMDLVPDLILLDLNLPYVDGLGVTAKLKSVQQLELVPIVALSSRCTRSERDRAMVAGCDGFLEKPIDVANFPSRIRELLTYQTDGKDPVDKTKLMRDFGAALVDQLRDKVEELESKNQELARRKSELKRALDRSQQANTELQRVNKLKENIVAITSHELRTPLSLAVGYLDVLVRGMVGEVNDDQKRVVDIANSSLEKMSALIDKISDLSRISQKKYPYDMQTVDLNEIFSNSMRGYEIFARLRKITLTTDLADHHLLVRCDPSLLDQVFSNLIKNALCYTPDGGTLSAKTWKDGGLAYCSLSDSGIGIEGKDLETIFDDFFQVQDPTQHRTGTFEFMTRGIGVGLTFCREILQELGGTIWAESEGLNHGSTFTLYLPHVRKHESVAAAQARG